MTTIFTNLVGRSVVSAITQTPGSGPFALVTTPPMSSLPIETASPVDCCAFNPPSDATRITPAAMSPNRYKTLLLMVSHLLRGRMAATLFAMVNWGSVSLRNQTRSKS